MDVPKIVLYIYTISFLLMKTQFFFCKFINLFIVITFPFFSANAYIFIMLWFQLLFNSI